MEIQKRGMITDRIKKLSKKLLGYEINTTELRLMPYVHYVMVNEHKINPIKVNQEEREILSKWRAAGYIEGGAGGMGITEEFWNIINKIIFLGYVDIDE